MCIRDSIETVRAFRANLVLPEAGNSAQARNQWTEDKGIDCLLYTSRPIERDLAFLRAARAGGRQHAQSFDNAHAGTLQPPGCLLYTSRCV